MEEVSGASGIVDTADVAAGFGEGVFVVVDPRGLDLGFDDELTTGDGSTELQSSDVAGDVLVSCEGVGAEVFIDQTSGGVNATLLITGEGGGTKHALEVVLISSISASDATTPTGGIP